MTNVAIVLRVTMMMAAAPEMTWFASSQLNPRTNPTQRLQFITRTVMATWDTLR